MQNYETLDANRLEMHWLEQTNLMHDACFAWVEARAKKEKANAALKEYEAGLYLTIKEDPERFGLLKPTNEAIKASILIDAQYTIHRDLCIVCQMAVDIADADLKILTDRKAAIAGLVELHRMNYFATPYIPDKPLLPAQPHEAKGTVVKKQKKRTKTKRA